jgi:Diadenosine tetraphosphate (Ap4A) hydrolase and other HIT family hydrolases
MQDCVFCRMVAGEIKPEVVVESDQVLAFRDINPMAPVHVLVIPKRHIAGLNALEAEHAELVGQMLLMAKRVAELEGVADAGYRTVINCGRDGGQLVPHLHVHVLGGRALGWPPG